MVYQCQSKVNGRTVAVKVPKTYTEEDRNERMFLRRVLEEGDPDQVNIIRLLDVIVVKGIPSMVLEYLPMSLFGLLRSKGRMTLSQVRCLGLQLLCAINFLTSLHVVHGDIKTENIMVANPNEEAIRVKLIDLGGFEVDEEHPPEEYEELTTIYFRSPEVLMGCPVSFPIDVWAVSLVCIEAFLGILAFPAETEQDLVAYFREVLEMPIPDDITLGSYAGWFLDGNPDGSYAWKVSTPKYRCRLGHNLVGLFNFIDTDRENYNSYMNDMDQFLNFLREGLRLSPKDRFTAEKCLEEDFITTSHFLCDGSGHEKEAYRLLGSVLNTSFL